MRPLLLLLALVGALACTVTTTPAPAPTPTPAPAPVPPPTVTPAPASDASTARDARSVSALCSSACDVARTTPCAPGKIMASRGHCLGVCMETVKDLAAPGVACVARITTCNDHKGCAP